MSLRALEICKALARIVSHDVSHKARERERDDGKLQDRVPQLVSSRSGFKMVALTFPRAVLLL